MKKLQEYNPCSEALEYYNEQKNFKEAWENCPRGDWMLWIAYRLKVDSKLILLTSVKCARTVQHLMKDSRSIKALDVFESYAKGKSTEEEFTAARATTTAAADDAAAYAAAYAAADAAAYAAAAYAAAYAADDAAARVTNRLKTADICRGLLTKEVLKRIK